MTTVGGGGRGGGGEREAGRVFFPRFRKVLQSNIFVYYSDLIL